MFHSPKMPSLARIHRAHHIDGPACPNRSLRFARFHIQLASNRAPTPPYEVENQGDYGENDQEVDQSPCDVERHPREQPSDKEYEEQN
jgi:hypothetical protein